MLVINELGDHQVNDYFEFPVNDDGTICQGEVGMEKVFAKMKEIQQKSFQDLGGEYIERNGNEKTAKTPRNGNERCMLRKTAGPCACSLRPGAC